MRPTLYVTNWSSHRTPGCHGSGRKLTIMAAPRHWEKGDGTVSPLEPQVEDLHAVKSGRMTVDEYRRRYEAHMAAIARMLPLGSLHFEVPPFDETPEPVRSGDTLCCACSRAEAAAGRCHRVWAAKALAAAGWNIILDGEPLEHA